ncbi:DNA polymerase Y family protein [Azospirillum halopraeferens]|uniref:Y-family DNA polymerase n=1 Tax=Azospirillum halopraeferens TaxID=34010 RepID=UPI00041BBC1B|nr:DNA polymerase Y family protein [Azospirillum halopraeferens]
MARRILSLRLPRLATDARARRQRATAAGGGERPAAAVAGERGRLTVVAVDRAAEAAGVRPGMTLADARALEPGLDAFDADPAGDARLLDRLAGWALRYTPWTAVDGADGLLLDITGCAHLLGGESPLLRDVTERLAAAGFASRAAIADTPAAAAAVARFAPAARRIVPPGGARAALDPLPVAALRLPAAVVDGLAAVGLRRIGDLHPVPRAALTARFGPLVGRRLDQALGHLDEPLSPHRPVPRHAVRLAFAEPITAPESIAGAIRLLLDRLCAGLERAQEGARRLELEVHRTDLRPDDTPPGLAVGTARPSRDPAALMRLFAERLERIAPGPGIEAMALTAPETGPLGPVQVALDGGGDDAPLEELVDRLGNRLGPASVLRLVPRPSWLPERTVAAAPPLDPPPDGPSWPADRPRPVRLLTPPEPVEAIAPVPDDPPVLFRWRGAVHRVRRADGPERLEAEWWRTPAEPRDYYRVEDETGRRFWLFRRGLYRPGVKAAWFLHGFFG